MAKAAKTTRRLTSSKRPKPLSPKAGLTKNRFCKGGRMRKK